MGNVRIYVLMILLAAINDIDRSALSVAAGPMSQEFQVLPWAAAGRWSHEGGRVA